VHDGPFAGLSLSPHAAIARLRQAPPALRPVAGYSENLVQSVGWREAAQIDKSQFRLFWRLLAKVGHDFIGETKDSHSLAVQGVRPADKVSHPMAAKELDVV